MLKKPIFMLLVHLVFVCASQAEDSSNAKKGMACAQSIMEEAISANRAKLISASDQIMGAIAEKKRGVYVPTYGAIWCQFAKDSPQCTEAMTSAVNTLVKTLGNDFSRQIASITDECGVVEDEAKPLLSQQFTAELLSLNAALMAYAPCSEQSITSNVVIMGRYVDVGTKYLSQGLDECAAMAGGVKTAEEECSATFSQINQAIEETVQRGLTALLNSCGIPAVTQSVRKFEAEDFHL